MNGETTYARLTVSLARHYIRDLVYGANDGIITTFAVVTGVVAAAHGGLVLTTGMIGHIRYYRGIHQLSRPAVDRHLSCDQRVKGLVRLDRVQAPGLWNVANAQGKRVGLFNIPMTYPPPPVDGFAVAGMLTPEGGGQTPEGFILDRLVRLL